MPVGTLAVDAITATPDTSVKDLARTMGEEGIGDLVIVEGDEPVGIVTDRDVALAYGARDDLDSLTAADLMTDELVTIGPDAEAIELPRLMGERKVRRVPVVNDDGTLYGIVTLDDVVATVGEELAHIADVIEAQSPAYDPETE